jgi:NTE family protein
MTADNTSLGSPVESIAGDSAADRPAPGIALCLSGGGFRAMLFHLGSLWRLNELGYLAKIDRVSSVSGGSITAGVLGLNWGRLQFDAQRVAQAFDPQLVQPIRALAGETLDAPGILGGLFGRGSVADRVAASYDRHLFHGATLQDLPDTPRFVINATNVQSAALWRFSKPYMRDWRVGEVRNPTTTLAVAVAASSAFPPVLSPVTLTLRESDYVPGSGAELQERPYTTRVVLTDGGVYDNLGLETAWKRYDTILVSDGGGRLTPDPTPHTDWARHALRVNGLIDNQVRSLRKRQVIGSYRSGARKGSYWGIRTNVAEYGLPDSLPCPLQATTALADTATRLASVDARLQERLINWGYAVCDAAMRRHVTGPLPPPVGFPYPGGVG